ncbi:MAG: biosynthetic peptidoglycan transglycosylase [Candidatus Aegiribacteria sp.]
MTGGKFLRTVFPVALGIFLILFVQFGMDALAGASILGRLRDSDPAASVADVDIGGKVAVIDRMALPGRGLFLERTVVYWSGNPFSPTVDSLLVLGGSWVQTRSGGPAEGRPGRGLPPCRFSGIRVHIGGDTSLVCGTLNPTRSGVSARLAMEGSWGALSGTVFTGGSGDSAIVDWFSCSRIPGGMIALPEMLGTPHFQGSMVVVRDGFLKAGGVVTGVDGDPAEVRFDMNDSLGYVSLSLSSRLETIREVLLTKADELMGGVYLDMDPSGHFTLDITDSDTIGVTVDARIDPLRVFSPGLADDTVTVVARLQFRGTFCIGSRTVSVDSGLVAVQEFPVNFSLRGSFSSLPRLELRLWNRSVDGHQLSRSVPNGMMGILEGLELAGDASFDLHAILDWGCPDSSDFSGNVNVSGLRVGYSPVSVGQLRQGGSCFMRDSWNGGRRIFLSPEQNQDFVVFDSLPPSFEGLLRCAEDATFRSHDGLCEYHIRNSLRANMETGRFTRGGSTITMQLARNLFLGREKTLARKLQEVFLTWRLEVYLSKDRMLEIYANIVELGPDVFGFSEAAEYYFQRDLRELSTRQMAYLVSILPGPGLYHRFFRNGRVPAYWEDYLDRLITISSSRGWIDPDSAVSALADSIVFSYAAEGF